LKDALRESVRKVPANDLGPTPRSRSRS
jgi:hypothetical protein